MAKHRAFLDSPGVILFWHGLCRFFCIFNAHEFSTRSLCRFDLHSFPFGMDTIIRIANQLHVQPRLVQPVLAQLSAYLSFDYA